MSELERAHAAQRRGHRRASRLDRRPVARSDPHRGFRPSVLPVPRRTTVASRTMGRVQQALSHPAWLGIGALAALATAGLTTLLVLGLPGSSHRRDAAQQTTRSTTRSTAVSTGSPRSPAKTERDPSDPYGGYDIEWGSRRTFFGVLKVTADGVGYGPGFAFIRTVTMRAAPVMCEFRLVFTGKVGSLAAGGWMYWVEDSDVDGNGALFVAYRMRHEPPTSPRCVPGGAVAEQAPVDGVVPAGDEVPWGSAAAFFDGNFHVAIGRSVRGGIGPVTLSMTEPHSFTPAGAPCLFQRIERHGTAGILSGGRVYWAHIDGIGAGFAVISGYRTSPAQAARLVPGNRCLR